MHPRRHAVTLLLLLAAGALATQAAADAGRSVAETTVAADRIDWRPVGDFERLVLTVSGPGGELTERVFAPGETAALAAVDAAGRRLLDGQYVYRLAGEPALPPEHRRRLAAARERGDERAAARLAARGPQGATQHGVFTVLDGAFVVPGAPERRTPTGLEQAILPLEKITAAAVFPEGVCVGADCGPLDDGGLETVLLKENNIRVKFLDTSAAAGFPTNDWQLTANDSAAGGVDRFSIEDLTGARVPFTIRAGAPTGSVFVDTAGRVGLRTVTPAADLHVTTGNTPAIRLEQNASLGFVAQTWDVAGNEANFFVRDSTGGPRLPFRIRPGAPTSSIDVARDGNVGLQCSSPDHDLTIGGTGAGCDTGTFSEIDAGETDFTVSSSRAIKENLRPVRVPDVLARIAAVDVYTYDFIDGAKDRMGLMAEDFHTVFGRGSQKLIKGQEVEMALWLAVQELTARNEALARRNEELDRRLAEIEARLAGATGE